jgi:hypothetical protein
MATRSRATAEKRRKEIARKEKQRLKAERRAARRLRATAGTTEPTEAVAAAE